MTKEELEGRVEALTGVVEMLQAEVKRMRAQYPELRNPEGDDREARIERALEGRITGRAWDTQTRRGRTAREVLQRHNEFDNPTIAAAVAVVRAMVNIPEPEPAEMSQVVSSANAMSIVSNAMSIVSVAGWSVSG